jgi:hypothetical protein
MNSLLALTRAAFAALAAFMLLSACGQAKSPYTFSASTKEVAMDGNAVIDVRLVHELTGKPVENALVFDTRFDMGPEGMGGMAAPVEAQGSPEPGVYRFKVAPTMEGRWALTLNAKVQGAAETVTGTIVVTAR